MSDPTNANKPATPATPTGPFERLHGLLGFQPTKQIGPSGEIGPSGGSVFAAALKKVVSKRAEVNEVKAVQLIEQAVEQKWNEQERKFENEKKKFFKDFGKVMTRIEAVARGESLASVEAKEACDQQKETCNAG